MRTLPGYGVVVTCILLLCTTDAAAQTLLERTPNVSGGWVGGPNSLHFNFLHRFNNSGAPLRQVTNRPTFLLAYRAPFPLLVGAQYATRSDLVDRMPNEWEAFGRYGVLAEDRGHPVDVSGQLAYNVAAESVDGELSVARRIGPVRLLAAGRAFSAAFGEDQRFAVAGGASVRLGQWLALSADMAWLTDKMAGEDNAWGTALQLGIPYTPHSLSIQRTNTNTATLQGSSRGGGDTRWGFEFTVPVAVSRYTRGRESATVAAPATLTGDSAQRAAFADSIARAVRLQYEQQRREDSLRFALRDDSARLAQQMAALRNAAREDSMRAAAAQQVRQDSARRTAEQQQARPPVRASIRNLAFAPARITIDVGTTIIWRNNDQVEHTVTAKDRSWDSGIIKPGATWQRTFTRAGTYEFFCAPHPFMTGAVVVRSR